MGIWPKRVPLSVPLSDCGCYRPSFRPLFEGTLLFTTVLFLPLRQILPPQTVEAGPGPLCLTWGWRNQLRRLSFLQGAHHPQPCSCQAHQAHQGPLGHQAPSATLAWRFNNISLSTCRVSAGAEQGIGVGGVPALGELAANSLAGSRAQVLHS